MLKYIISVYLIIFFIPIVMYAQHSDLRVYVSDGYNGSPIADATIILTAKHSYGLTNHIGMASFTDVQPGAYNIIISHILYAPIADTITINNYPDTTIQFMLTRKLIGLDNVTINSTTASKMNCLKYVDFLLRPVNTTQDMLRSVPGLFIAQHAGGGKAEQIFLRGFDIDHGTDIHITADGVPVNMVSHAHGQGYADLHYIIPETVETVDFKAGPYETAKGNLATAGYVDFKTKNFIDANSIQLEAGNFNTQKITGLFKVYTNATDNIKEQLYVASSYARTQGYFELPQNFYRWNLMGSYSLFQKNKSLLSVKLSSFGSKWGASGQIPLRAVQSGLTSNFGAIDSSEGGNTGRTNLSVSYDAAVKHDISLNTHAYYTRYRFNLFSNFTFFLEDSINGDEINQAEKRSLMGLQQTASKKWQAGNSKMETSFAIGFRYDHVPEIFLNKVKDRVFLSTVQSGAVNETNSFAYLDQLVHFSPKWTMQAGLRYDYFNFRYEDAVSAQAISSKQKGTFSPKLNIHFTPSPQIHFFLNNGIGFHSNDSRVVLDAQARSILPKVFGTDVGFMYKPANGFMMKFALWRLYSQQEFVYVGDAGIVEPGGRSLRKGIDVSVRYAYNRWLFADVDVNLARARAMDQPDGENYIPLAPLFTSIGGITAKMKNGFSGSLRYRFMDDRPANETNSVIAKGYFITDIVLHYQWKKFACNLAIENVLNQSWREAQFDTESRLKNEPMGISEIHFTPGTPRFIKAGIQFNF